jgi:hypothetical protein
LKKCLGIRRQVCDTFGRVFIIFVTIRYNHAGGSKKEDKKMAFHQTGFKLMTVKIYKLLQS